jgi:hypothetical protein
MTDTLWTPPERGLPPGHFEARREHLMSEITQVLKTRRMRPPRRRLRFAAPIGVSAAVAVAVIVAIVLGPSSLGLRHGSAAYAATPPVLHYGGQQEVPAAPLLAKLADQAANQLSGVPDRFQYLKLQSWSLFTRVDGVKVTSKVVPSTTESWIAADGSGRQVIRVGGKVKDQLYAAGQFPRMYDVRLLSTDPTVLVGQLALGHPPANGPAEVVVAVTDLWKQQAPSPSLQGALLRVLAATPGLTSPGQVTDRGGRKGVAVSIQSAYTGLPTTYTMILDPSTGALLDYEEVLTTSAGKLNVRIPAVVGYSLWVAHGFVPGDR